MKIAELVTWRQLRVWSLKFSLTNVETTIKTSYSMSTLDLEQVARSHKVTPVVGSLLSQQPFSKRLQQFLSFLALGENSERGIATITGVCLSLDKNLLWTPWLVLMFIFCVFLWLKEVPGFFFWYFGNIAFLAQKWPLLEAFFKVKKCPEIDFSCT